MAERVGLEAVLDLTQFNRDYKAYKNALNDMNKQTGDAANSLSQSFLGFGASLNKLAIALGVTLVAAAGAATVAIAKMTIDGIQKAADLEMQISNIAAVLNLTNDEAGFLKDVIIDLGLDPTLKVTTFEAAQAMELLAKNGIFAGMSTEDMAIAAAEAGRAVVFLANATGAEFGQAANIATSAMTLFGLEATDLVGIVSSITSVTTNSKFTIHDYELALRNGGAAAAAFGVSLDDFNVVVAATADELGTGMRDGTSFANMLYRLTPNSDKAKDAMQELGWVTASGSNIFYDAEGNLKGVNDIAQILYNTLEGESKIMVEVGGRTAEQNKLLGELRAEYDAAQETVADYTTGVKGMLASEDEKNKALEEAQNIINITGPKIDELVAIQGDYVESTKQLTSEQKLLAIETIFGRDALGAVLGVMKEGAPIVDDVARVMDALAVSEEEAFALVSSGITEYELLQQTMERTDAVENAKTRMDNLHGSMEILSGIIEALSIEVGDQFLPILDKIVKAFTDWLNNSQPLQEQLINIADAVAGFVEALFNGEDPIDSFSKMLKQIGGEDLSTKFDNVVTSVQNFIDPIKTFVEEHQEAFITGLKAIGIALGGMMIASAVAGALSLLINPVTILIGLAGALGFAWSENFLGIQDKVNAATEAVTGFLDEIGLLEAFDSGGIQGVFEGLPGALQKTGGKIQTWLQNIDWGALYQGFIDGVGEIGTNLGTIFNDIDWSKVAETIITALGDAMAIGAALLYGTAKVIIDTLIAFFTSFITEVDWSEFVTELGTGLQNGLQNVQNFIQPLIDKVKEVDWLQVGSDIVGFIVDGLLTFANFSLSTWGTIYDTFVTWKDGINWFDLGVQLILAILTGLATFVELAWETLGTWEQTFRDWLDGIDWSQFGYDVTTFVLDGLYTFVTRVGETLQEWYSTISTWFTDTDWQAEGSKVIDELKKRWEKFWEDLSPTFNKFWEDIKKWWDEIDWYNLGENIIDGIIDGVGSKLEAAKAAILGIAEGVKDAWDDFWRSHSPSRLMIESGEDIMSGVGVGVKSETSPLEGTMQNAATDIFGSFLTRANDILPYTGNSNPVQNTNNSTTNNYNLNNNFAGNPQITDANQLRLILAGYQ